MKQETNDSKWLDEIREELSDFQAEIPAGGWERLSSELPVSETSPHIAGKKRIVPIWITSSAAAILLLIGYLIFSHNRPDADIDQTIFEEITAELEKDVTPNTDNSISHSVENKDIAPVYSENKGNYHRKTSAAEEAPTTETMTIVPSVIESKNIVEETPTCEKTVTEVTPATEVKTVTEVKTEEEVLIAMETASKTMPRRNRKNSSSDHWAMGVLLGGNSGSNADLGNSFIGAGPKMYSSVLERCQSNSPGSSENTRSGKANGQNSEEEEHILASDNHRSWSFGLSVQKHLSERFAIETGLVYSVLSSDVEISSSRAFDIYYNYGTVSQRLQYLGIPLKLNVTLFDSNNWHVYANGGTTIERCLSAKRDDKSLHTNHWQLSLNAAAGIQYNFSKYLGVYAEPGVNYYFDNKTSIPTQRSEQPLMFNLNAGLRVNL